MAVVDGERRDNFLVLIGTRPEAIKMLPVVLALRRSTVFRPVVVTTGQHADLVAPILELGAIEPDYDLGVGHPGLTLNELVSSVVTDLDRFCRDRFGATGQGVTSRDQIREGGFPAGMLVHGDTSSAPGVLQSAHPRRPCRGRPPHREHAHTVPRGAEPPADRAHRGVPPRPDGAEPAEPGARGHPRRARVRHRQHRHRRPPLRLDARRPVRGRRGYGRVRQRQAVCRRHGSPSRELGRRPGSDRHRARSRRGAAARRVVRRLAAPEPARPRAARRPAGGSGQRRPDRAARVCGVRAAARESHDRRHRLGRHPGGGACARRAGARRAREHRANRGRPRRHPPARRHRERLDRRSHRRRPRRPRLVRRRRGAEPLRRRARLGTDRRRARVPRGLRAAAAGVRARLLAARSARGGGLSVRHVLDPARGARRSADRQEEHDRWVAP